MSYENQKIKTPIFLLGLDELRHSPEALTYIWSDQLARAEGVKSIGVLWEGMVE